MNTWDQIPLGDICSKIGSGATPRGGQEAYKSEGISLIRSMNVYDFAFINDGLAFIDDAQANKLKGVTVKANDILINITGASVGRCCIVPNAVLPACVNQHVAIIRLKLDVANPAFVLNAINSPYYKDVILNRSTTGATREALTKEDLSQFKVPLPPLPIQRKIAAILSAYDDLIENNTRRITLIEQMAEEVYREWFVRLRFPGHESVPVYQGVPEGWEPTILGEIANISMGQSPSSELYNAVGIGLPFHQGVGTYGARFPRKEIFCTEEKRKAKRGDILFSVRAPVGRLNIANDDLIIGRGLAAINHKQGFNSYLFYLLNHTFSSEDLIGNGSIFNSVGKDELSSVKVLMPKLATVKRFDALSGKMDTQIENLYGQSERLKRTRNMLIPRLLSGKLAVESLDIQFPPGMSDLVSAGD